MYDHDEVSELLGDWHISASADTPDGRVITIAQLLGEPNEDVRFVALSRSGAEVWLHVGHREINTDSAGHVLLTYQLGDLDGQRGWAEFDVDSSSSRVRVSFNEILALQVENWITVEVRDAIDGTTLTRTWVGTPGTEQVSQLLSGEL